MLIVEDSENEWALFERGSPQSTVYSTAAFLQSYPYKPRYFFCVEDGKKIGGIALLVNDRGAGVQGLFQQYNGLHFADFSTQPNYKRIELQHEVAAAFAESLYPQFSDLAITSHWSVVDVRPFQWFNYHDRAKGYYSHRVTYTSLLGLHPEELKANCKKVRLNSLRTSEKHGLRTEIVDDLAVLDLLHSLTFKRQGLERSEAEVLALNGICRALWKAKQGLLFVTYQGNDPVSASFIGIKGRSAFYVFGATDPDFRKTECGTRNLFDVFQYLFETLKIPEIDLVGVNSPQRGAFKLSFGGSLTPIFSVSKIAGSA